MADLAARVRQDVNDEHRQAAYKPELAAITAELVQTAPALKRAGSPVILFLPV
jgi:hypothetical protein